MFSLFFTSFSECRVQLLAGAFLKHSNYLYWKAAHCMLLNSKFHIKKKAKASVSQWSLRPVWPINSTITHRNLVQV